MSRRVSTAEVTSLWAFISLFGGITMLLNGRWLAGIGLLLVSAVLFFYPLMTMKGKKSDPEMVCPSCRIRFQFDAVRLRGCPNCNWPLKNRSGVGR